MVEKLALGLALLGPHPAMTEEIAVRAALVYVPGYTARCAVTRRRARCIVRDRRFDYDAGVTYLVRWDVRLRLDASGRIKLAG